MWTLKQIALAALLLVPVSGCSVYRVSDSSGRPLGGIPFYARSAECRQQTIWQEDVRNVSLQVVELVSGTGEAGKRERSIFSASKLVAGRTIDGATALRKTAQETTTLAHLDALYAAFEALPAYQPADWANPTYLVLAANSNAPHHIVDYSRPYFLNTTRPITGSASATAEIAADGTLSKASAEVESKTLETLLAMVPIKEKLLDRWIGSPDISALTDEANILARLEIEYRPVLHTLTRSTPLTQQCPQLEPIAATEQRSASYTRTQVTAPREAAQAPGQGIGFTGQITLPRGQ